MKGKSKKRKIVIVLLIVFLVIVLLLFAVMWGVSYDSTSSTELEENEVSIESFDGYRLVAQKETTEDSHLWVKLIHGYRADRSMMVTYSTVYIANGFNVLMTDNRAHGKSDGKYIGMGYLD